MSHSKKYFPTPPMIPIALILSSLVMTLSFMNCNFDSELSDSGVSNQQSSVLEPADYEHIVNQLASQYLSDLNEACTSFYFLDQVVEALRDEDTNFGYSCQEGDCESISKDSVAFYKGSQDGQKDLSNVFVIKVIDNVCEDAIDPSVDWNIQSEDVISKWKFPRMTGSQETNSINTESNCSPENKEALLQELSTTYSQDFSASCEDIQDWSFIDRALDRLYSNDNHWGYFCIDGDCNNLSTNTIGYSCGTGDSALSLSIINIIDCDQDSPQLTWIDDTQNLIIQIQDSDAAVGWRYPRIIYEDVSQIVSELREPAGEGDEEDSQDLASQADDSTTPQRIDGRCNNDVKDECHEGNFNDRGNSRTLYRWECVGIGGGSTDECERRRSCGTDEVIQDGACVCKGGYGRRDGRGACLPSCGTKCVEHSGAGQCASGNDCNDRNSYDIVDLGSTYDVDQCCKRTPKPPQTPVNGDCNNLVKNACSKGTFKSQTDSTTQYKWQCAGSNGGSTDNCSKQKTCPYTTQTACKAGLPSNQECYVNSDLCFERRAKTSPDPVNGVCNNSVNNRCTAGTLRNQTDTTTQYKWQCVGSNGGTTDSCSKNKPINGDCNNSVKNECSKGTPHKTGTPDDSTTHYNWQCIGRNSGTTDNCQKAKFIHGQCNIAVRNGCRQGTANDAALDDTTTRYRWQCEGSGGGAAVNCSKAKPPGPVNGVCNNLVRNGCSKGTPNDTAIADTSTLYKWHCVGENSGNTATNCQKTRPNCTCNQTIVDGCGSADCSAVQTPNDTTTYNRWTCRRNNVSSTGSGTCQKAIPPSPVNGDCNNSVKNACSKGNFRALADTTAQYNWQCVGLNGGSTKNCQKAIPQREDGVCAATHYNCVSSGTAQSIDIHDISRWKWYCLGTNGGSRSGLCQEAKPPGPVNGVCNNLVRNGCSKGTPNDTAIADTSTLYKWHCVGENSGNTATNCQKTRPNCTCNQTIVDGCGSADCSAVQTPNDTTTYNRWTCRRNNVSSTGSGTCQKAKPPTQKIIGRCSSTQKNSCSKGNFRALADTTTQYNWQCVGSNGGTTDNCQKAKFIHGQCNIAVRNGCRQGTANDAALDDTTTHYKWQCEGLGGGTAVNCTKAKPPTPVNGVCNNLVRNGCSSGTANDTAIADTSTYYKWQCAGLNGGTTAHGCQKTRPNCTCNQTIVDGCGGTGCSAVQTPTDTTTYHKWTCRRNNVSSTGSGTCQKAIPATQKIIGRCSSTQKNSCTAGTFHPHPPDSNTQYLWTCRSIPHTSPNREVSCDFPKGGGTGGGGEEEDYTGEHGIEGDAI